MYRATFSDILDTYHSGMPYSSHRGIKTCFPLRRICQSPEPVQLQAAAKEEAKEQNRLQQPPIVRARKAVPVPEILVPRRQRRSQSNFGAQQRSG